MANFKFTGEAILNGMETKKPYTASGVGKTGTAWRNFSLAVAEKKNNRAFCEFIGSQNKSIKVNGIDGEKLEIDPSAANDEDILKKVASYCKRIVKIGDNRKEFIYDWDFVNYLVENADAIKGKTVTVTGRVTNDIYKGKFNTRFQLQNLYLEDGDDVRNKLSVSMDLAFNKDSFDLSDWASEQKIYINGYISEYIKAEKENRFIPQQVVFDCSKLDLSNEDIATKVNYRLKLLGLENKDGKLVSKLKNNMMYQLRIVTSYQNGAEEVEFNESMLTDIQKEAIKFGINKLEDFRPAGQAFGDRVVLFKLVEIVLKDDYASGMVELMSQKDFDEQIYTIPTEETLTNVVEAVAPSSEKKEEDSAFDLFG